VPRRCRRSWVGVDGYPARRHAGEPATGGNSPIRASGAVSGSSDVSCPFCAGAAGRGRATLGTWVSAAAAECA
jgi:hypothetical protein